MMYSVSVLRMCLVREQYPSEESKSGIFIPIAMNTDIFQNNYLSSALQVAYLMCDQYTYFITQIPFYGAKII